jgi:acetoin utilization deacetylase AcuC-like enzyme
VPPGSDDHLYLSLVDHVVAPLASAYEPQLLLVSAGYDAHAEDPLAECHVSDEGFGAMTVAVRRIASSLGVPLGFVLEGGYALSALARSVAATLAALSGPLPGVDGEPAWVAPIARAARERLSEFWGSLG